MWKVNIWIRFAIVCNAIETNNIWGGRHEPLRNRIILNYKEKQTRAHIVTQQLKSLSNISNTNETFSYARAEVHPNKLWLLLLLFSPPYITQPGLLVLFYFYVHGCFRVQGCKIRLKGTCPLTVVMRRQASKKSHSSHSPAACVSVWTANQMTAGINLQALHYYIYIELLDTAQLRSTRRELCC